MRLALFEANPKRRYLVVPDASEGERTIRTAIGELAQLNERHAYSYDRDTLVFVEVKTRENLDRGRPEEAVTPAKQRQIRRIAEAYLALNRLENAVCRFDVLALLRDDGGGFAIQHIRDAF